MAAYLGGLAKKSFISRSSAIASSAPATSANVVCGTSGSCNFARERPNENTFPPPPCAWLIMKKKSKPMSKIGANENRNETKSDCFGTSTVQPFAGGLPVSASITVGSWRTT